MFQSHVSFYFFHHFSHFFFYRKKATSAASGCTMEEPASIVPLQNKGETLCTHLPFVILPPPPLLLLVFCLSCVVSSSLTESVSLVNRLPFFSETRRRVSSFFPVPETSSAVSSSFQQTNFGFLLLLMLN